MDTSLSLQSHSTKETTIILRFLSLRSLGPPSPLCKIGGQKVMTLKVAHYHLTMETRDSNNHNNRSITPTVKIIRASKKGNNSSRKGAASFSTVTMVLRHRTRLPVSHSQPSISTPMDNLVQMESNPHQAAMFLLVHKISQHNRYSNASFKFCRPMPTQDLHQVFQIAIIIIWQSRWAATNNSTSSSNSSSCENFSTTTHFQRIKCLSKSTNLLQLYY